MDTNKSDNIAVLTLYILINNSFVKLTMIWYTKACAHQEVAQHQHCQHNCCSDWHNVSQLHARTCCILVNNTEMTTTLFLKFSCQRYLQYISLLCNFAYCVLQNVCVTKICYDNSTLTYMYLHLAMYIQTQTCYILYTTASTNTPFWRIIDNLDTICFSWLYSIQCHIGPVDCYWRLVWTYIVCNSEPSAFTIIRILHAWVEIIIILQL